MAFHAGTTSALLTPYDNNTWSSPFSIGYISVGRRRLVGSRSEVVELVIRHRPDILFLGHLVTALHHIGRLKKQLERHLKDEWFVTTNISASSGRPVGMGAVIHCSSAKHMLDCVGECPEGQNPQTWEAAVGGHVLNIKISRQVGWLSEMETELLRRSWISSWIKLGKGLSVPARRISHAQVGQVAGEAPASTQLHDLP
jgi:hypothetical protein